MTRRIPTKFAQMLTFAATIVLATTGIAAPSLMQGPMLGNISHDKATIWARVGGNHNFSLRYSESATLVGATETESVAANASNDYCVSIELTDLEPGTFYYYQVLLDGQLLDNPRERDGYPILTSPAPGREVKFSIAFGSGAKVDEDGLQAIWLQVQNARPHSFFWLGEQTYVNDLRPEFQAEKYRKQRNVPFLQPLLRSVPQLASWEAPNNASKANIEESLAVFKRYWANPAYGTKDVPGTYFKYEYGGVDFFVLDTFTYRTETGILLGDGQMAWIKDELSKSAAKFKVLLSGKSWSNEANDEVESWSNYKHARNRLFAHIKENDIPGVLLITGASHQAEIKAIPMSDDGGYDLYEFVSSPLAQDPDPVWQETSGDGISIQDPYSESMNFGLMTFTMNEEDPQVAFEIINVFGESVFPSFQVNASELSNGIASWKSKVDAETLPFISKNQEEPTQLGTSKKPIWNSATP